MTTTLDLTSLNVRQVAGSPLSFVLELPPSLRLLGDREAPPRGCGCMRIPNPARGDDRVVWDARDFAQIADAKRTFDELVLRGLTPYRVGIDGAATSEVMDEFDPVCEEVIFVPLPLIRGGAPWQP